ncbi:hypothetical protein GCM10010412_091510 [Nonomuraea recticatena]|uniref:Uncharacterized protein n=1 Tax=Nonomuraea recticatena TaxID=46178 RepID=A0ABN3TBD5_9ACTN
MPLMSLTPGSGAHMGGVPSTLTWTGIKLSTLAKAAAPQVVSTATQSAASNRLSLEIPTWLEIS